MYVEIILIITLSQYLKFQLLYEIVVNSDHMKATVPQLFIFLCKLKGNLGIKFLSLIGHIPAGQKDHSCPTGETDRHCLDHCWKFYQCFSTLTGSLSCQQVSLHSKILRPVLGIEFISNKY